MVLLAATGLLSGSLGVASLSNLASSYRQSDIALTESPATFQAWIVEAASVSGSLPAGMSDLVASRLLAMPLEKRRDLVAALMQHEFWQPLTKERETPRALQQAILAGVIKALHKAPMAGDLYLAAAWLEIRTAGFGSRARELLKASHLFAPRELPLITERLALAPSIWPLLNPEERALLKADIDTMRRVAPDRAEKIEAALAVEGVIFQ